jgi:polysaccharide pyruvyl transferase WcaK-like protein
VGKKVALIGLYYFNNMGDPLYIETTMLLLNKLSNAEIKIIDIYGKTKWDFSLKKSKEHGNIRTLKSFLYRCIRFMISLLRRLFKNHFLVRQYYSQIRDDVDVVIVPGGGYVSLCATYPFHHRFAAIEKACEKAHAVLCMNAVGMSKDVGEILHFEDEWKKILRNKTLLYLSCRDGKDIFESLSGREVDQVGCTASLAGDLYGISKDENSDIIGIGVIRGNAFSMYGYDFSESQLIEFYARLFRAVQKKTPYKPVLFTNGLDSDIEIAYKVEKKLHAQGLLVEMPRSPKDLVYTISKFKAVVCARMHAAIVAFSMNIPTVLICWGIKGKDFMKMAGASDFAVDPSELTADYVYELLQKAIGSGTWPNDCRHKIQQSAVSSVLKMMEISGIEKKDIVDF